MIPRCGLILIVRIQLGHTAATCLILSTSRLYTKEHLLQLGKIFIYKKEIKMDTGKT